MGCYHLLFLSPCVTEALVFSDAKGDCKVGDFGLATSSLAAVDPSDVTRHSIHPEADMTLGTYTQFIPFFVIVDVVRFCRGRNEIVYCSRSSIKEKGTEES